MMLGRETGPAVGAMLMIDDADADVDASEWFDWDEWVDE